MFHRKTLKDKLCCHQSCRNYKLRNKNLCYIHNKKVQSKSTNGITFLIIFMLGFFVFSYNYDTFNISNNLNVNLYNFSNSFEEYITDVYKYEDWQEVYTLHNIYDTILNSNKEILTSDLISQILSQSLNYSSHMLDFNSISKFTTQSLDILDFNSISKFTTQSLDMLDFNSISKFTLTLYDFIMNTTLKEFILITLDSFESIQNSSQSMNFNLITDFVFLRFV
jgi:ABC-type phosphate/phosphonate transport system permease subunit